MKLYDRIRELCEARGMSVAALEKVCGFAPCSVQKWNRSAPSAYKLKAVAQVFEMSLDDLLAEEPLRKDA